MADTATLQLIQRCLAQDEEACGELLDLYKNQIFTFILRMAGDAADAEDLAQETFIKAFTRLDSYKPEYPFITWLFKIAHNTCLDHFRAKKPQALSIDDEDIPIELEDMAAGPDRLTEWKLQTEETERLLSSLPPLYREAMLLQYRDELTCREIAEVTQVPEGTVKIRLSRAKAMLRGKLETIACLAGAKL